MDKSKFGLILRDQKRGEEGEKRKREKKRKRKRIRREEKQSQTKVWNYMVLYGTKWAFKALNGFSCNCMVISCLKT